MRGSEITRFRLSTRLLHWTVTASFLVLGLTGLFLYAPQFQIVTQDIYTRVIHRIVAMIFIAAPLIYFLARPGYTLSFIRVVFTWEEDEIAWFKAAPNYYFGGDANKMPPQGFIGTGQKLWTMAAFFGSICFTATGVLMWLFKAEANEVFLYSVFIHDICFIVGGSFTLVHIYLGIIHPQTKESIHSMITGMISIKYAERHHGKWLREILNGQECREDL